MADLKGVSRDRETLFFALLLFLLIEQDYIDINKKI